MPEEITGREEEKAILDEVTNAPTAALIAVYGRRRVGKTYLIRTYLQKQMVFEFSGIHNVTTEVQLENFTKKLAVNLNNNIALPIPANWFDAFDILAALLTKKLRKKKAVVFLDEFPWLQTPKSNFLAAFENFWNTWANKQNNLAIILCGSAASWMIKNVVRNRGGLHNRITHKIALQPFTLNETEQFLQHKKINLNRYQITQLYMALGGIPHYLNQIKPGQSAAQIIDSACFTKTGFLYNEFTDLYQALFDTAERHIKIIRALASKPMGLSRGELIKTCKLQSGGSTTTLLDELTASGFITPYIPFGKQTKDAIYKLTDEFSLFYLKFMETNRAGTKGTWLKLSDTPGWKSWSGLAFETICLKHVTAIKKTLGITGIFSENSIWKSKPVKNGSAAQIDLVINRRDNSINLCEIKFYENEFTIDKKYAVQLENKKHQFKLQTQTKKHLFITLISTHTLQQNANSVGLIDNVITLDKLFKQRVL
jgi:uncharacterized protein